MTESLDLTLNDIARDEKPRRLHRGPDTARCASEKNVSGLEGHAARQVVDEVGDAEQHLLGGRILAELAVDPGFQSEALRVRDLVRGRDPGADGAEGVEALRAVELTVRPLPVPGRDVVPNRVTEHRVERVLLAHTACHPVSYTHLRAHETKAK